MKFNFEYIYGIGIYKKLSGDKDKSSIIILHFFCGKVPLLSPPPVGCQFLRNFQGQPFLNLKFKIF